MSEGRRLGHRRIMMDRHGLPGAKTTGFQAFFSPF
jgi:hypothetical protein